MPWSCLNWTKGYAGKIESSTPEDGLVVSGLYLHMTQAKERAIWNDRVTFISIPNYYSYLPFTTGPYL